MKTLLQLLRQSAPRQPGELFCLIQQINNLCPLPGVICEKHLLFLRWYATAVRSSEQHWPRLQTTNRPRAGLMVA